jgi:hypothetical protein
MANLTVDQRKKLISQLREEHEDYFQTIGNINALFIPKSAYRPSGKDELHLQFFTSELAKNQDIYTEFTTIDLVAEDPKRTLYFLKYNPKWEGDYENGLTNGGYEVYWVPVTELKVINDVTNRGRLVDDFANLPDPDVSKNISDDSSLMVKQLIAKLEEINQTLKTLINGKYNK